MSLKISEVDWLDCLWDVSKNLEEFGKTADDVTCGSNKKYFWRCSEICKFNCPHVWSQSPYIIYQGNIGCPFKGCRDKPAKYCVHDMLNFTHPKLIDEWCHEKNGSLKPENFTHGSNVKVWWKCPDICSGCNEYHIYLAAINSRASRNTCCPFCSWNGDSKFPHCLETSFAGLHPKLMKEWHPTKNKKIDPIKLLPNSNSKVWWLCKKSRFNCDCVHEWEASPNSRTRIGSSCPFCSSPALRICIHNSLAYLKKDLMLDWDYDKNKKDGLDPTELSIGSGKYAYWICQKNPNHKYSMVIYNRTSSNQGCPFCVNKTESLFYDWLIKEYSDNKISREISFDWCMSKSTGTKSRFDFVFDDLKLIIEIDGRQHFEQTSNWSSPIYNQILDFYKMEKALENGYSIVRVFQEDIFSDKNDWQEKTKKAIKELQDKSETKLGSIIYIGSDDKYKEYGEYFQATQKYKAITKPKSKEQQEKDKVARRNVFRRIISCEMYDDIDEI